MILNLNPNGMKKWQASVFCISKFIATVKGGVFTIQYQSHHITDKQAVKECIGRARLFVMDKASMLKSQLICCIKNKFDIISR